MGIKTAKLEVTVVGGNAAASSLRSLAEALAQSLDGCLPHSVMLGDELGDLIRCEPVRGATAGKLELHGLQLLPSDRYLELVSAVTAPGHAHVAGVLHGWPILSAVDRNAIIAGPEAILGAGGPA